MRFSNITVQRWFRNIHSPADRSRHNNSHVIQIDSLIIYLPTPATITMLMHYVLSFHKGDTPVLGREVLSDVMNEFMEEFSPNGMGYGAVHNDQEHLHCHMVLTANEIESDKLIYKKRYLNKEQKERPVEERNYKERTFEESKNRIRDYARERAKQYAQQKQMAKEYQEHGLFHSYNEKYRTRTRNGKLKSKDRLDNQRRKNGRGTQQQKNRKGTILNLLKVNTMKALREGGSFMGFARKLQEQGYTLYRTKRGTINGILYEGKKYRFTTTLLPDAERKVLNEMRRGYERAGQGRDRQQRYKLFTV